MQRVTFDGRSVMVDGKRELLFSGAVHYPRSTPAMWPKILAESRKAGINCIETYVFWGRHEQREGQYDFSGRLDLGRFLDACEEQGLYAILRIGPYICAETNFGGLPWWLVAKPGMVTRTWNEPFMQAMERWVRVLLAQVGDRQCTRGGPVILAQMENEYCNVAGRYGKGGDKYLAWCSELGRAAGLEVPQIMCEGASEDVIETLNGFSTWDRVRHLRDTRPAQPALWTENWPGWYDTWGQPHHLRAPEEIAYEVLRFFAAGGTGVNYYMWHGGTNFARDAMYLQATSYDFDAPLDEYGLPTDKSAHLKMLHRFLKEHGKFFLEGRAAEPKILSGDPADGVVLYSYRVKKKELAVVVNGGDSTADVSARGVALSLPAKSGVALVGGRDEYAVAYRSWAMSKKRVSRVMEAAAPAPRWKMLREPMPAGRAAGAAWTPVRLPHNMLTSTRDQTDFGWYRATVSSRAAKRATLSVRVSDFLSVWVNGRHVGTVPQWLEEDRPRAADFLQSIEIPLRKGQNEVVLLATAIGMIKGDWMIDAPMSEEGKGLVSAVKIDGTSVAGPWAHSPGLWGERARVFDPVTSPLFDWGAPSKGGSPLRWYRASVAVDSAALAKKLPWALDIGSLRKGMIWVNGRCAGRYWQVPAAEAGEARYTRHPHLINTGHGRPVQSYYHIPPDWIREGENVLIVLEERGALPKSVRLVRRR